MKIEVNSKCVLEVPEDIPEEVTHRLGDSYLEDAAVIHTGMNKNEASQTIHEYLNYLLDSAVRESYYSMSPKIAKHLQEESNKELFYEYIYQMYVAPMLIYIAQHDDDRASNSVQQSIAAMNLFYSRASKNKGNSRVQKL